MTNHDPKYITMLVVAIFWVNLMQAQEGTNASGGDATGIDGSMAYSIGQVTYNTHDDDSGSITEGVQQAYEIFTVGIPYPLLSISISVFPSMTSDFLCIQKDKESKEKLQYVLYDMHGKSLHKGEILSKQTLININNLPSATYILRIVTQDNTVAKSFKIIKSK